MKAARVLGCVATLAALALLGWGCGRRTASPAPVKLDFTAARSSENDADVEIKEVVAVGADGSRGRPNDAGPDGLTCTVRAGGKEQKVASLRYG